MYSYSISVLYLHILVLYNHTATHILLIYWLLNKPKRTGLFMTTFVFSFLLLMNVLKTFIFWLCCSDTRLFFLLSVVIKLVSMWFFIFSIVFLKAVLFINLKKKSFQSYFLLLFFYFILFFFFFCVPFISMYIFNQDFS